MQQLRHNLTQKNGRISYLEEQIAHKDRQHSERYAENNRLREEVGENQRTIASLDERVRTAEAELAELATLARENADRATLHMDAEKVRRWDFLIGKWAVIE